MHPPLLPIRGGHLDLIRGLATVDGETASLTSTEVAVLSVLADAMPDPASEEDLLRKAWGYKATKTRTVSVAMSRLRAKVERNPRAPQVVLTVRGQGYRLVAAAAEPKEASPSPLPTLAGRAAEQAQVAAHRKAGRAVVELVGPGGVGTSTLARASLAGARWVELTGVRRPEGLIRRLCDGLRLEGARGEELVVEALRKAAPVVLDHAHDLDDEATQLLRTVLAEAAGPIFVTSRRPLGVGGRVMVGPLDDDAALVVLQTARADAGLPPLDPARAAPVLKEAGGFPLGLVLAAPLAELAGEGVALGLASDPEGALVTVLRETLSLCDDDDRALLALASAFAVSADLLALVDLANRPRVEVLRLLHRLRERGLVQLGQGRVQVPAAVAAVAATDAARQRHAAWVSELVTDPMVLRPLRHEVEAAIPWASGDILPHILMRHVVLLHVYGPTGRLDEEIVGLLHRVPSPGRRHVVLGAVLQSTDEYQAAYDSYRKALDELPDDDPEFRGWAWLQISVLATWLRTPNQAHRSVDPLLAIRPKITDRALWCSLAINAASMVAVEQPERATALFREVDPFAREVPSLALLAAFHRLYIEKPAAADVRLVEKQLAAVGIDRLGPLRWHAHGLRIGAAWLRSGDDDRAFAAFHEHIEEAWRLDPRAATTTLSLAAAGQLHRPKVARRIFGLLANPSDPVADMLRWQLGGAEGPAPIEDPTLQRIWADAMAGKAVEVERPWIGLTRALQHSQREADALKSS